MERKVILYIAMSLDGYIAKTNDDISFLNGVEKEGEDYGYNDFISHVDAVIIGRKTYEKVLSMVGSFPHADKDAYVITKFPKEKIGKTGFYNGDLTELVKQLKEKPGKHVFVDGGAQVVQALLEERLIDEIYISVIPILLGEGISLFKQGLPEQKLRLINSRSYDKGLVQLHYEVLK